MKNALLVIFLTAISLSLYCQNGVYRTFEDYKNNNLEDVGAFDYNAMSGSSGHIEYKKGNEDIELECKDFWGFVYYGVLFRNDNEHGGLAYIVVSQGKYVYYECGHFNFPSIQFKNNVKSKKTYDRTVGYYHCISQDLNSPFYSLVKVPGQLKKLVKKESKFSSLRNCYSLKNLKQKNLRACVIKDIDEVKNFIPWDKLENFTVPYYLE